jgi:hypothetical protein
LNYSYLRKAPVDYNETIAADDNEDDDDDDDDDDEADDILEDQNENNEVEKSLNSESGFNPDKNGNPFQFKK